MPMGIAIITTILQGAKRDLTKSIKINILNALLWGGVILLALEHIWHGEVVPWPPFLTAMANPADIPIMLYEIATIGTGMTLATTAIWGAILAINHYMPKITALKLAEGKLAAIKS